MAKRKNVSLLGAAELPQPVLQAPDAQTGAADGTEAEASTDSKRKQVSKRDYLDSAGAVVEKIEEATGARYTLLVPSGNVDFDEQFGKAGDFATMCAILGFHTKVGNVANTVLNDKDEPGSFEDCVGEIKDFIAKAKTGTWAERSGGGAAQKVDREALAGAIVAVAIAGNLVTEADRDATYAKVRQRLEDEPAYLRSARQVPDVAREYATRVGKAAKSIGDLL